MRIHRLVYSASIVALILGMGSSTLGAQEQMIPKELALALITMGGSDGGEIIVGQVPPDLAATFTVPPARAYSALSRRSTSFRS